MAKNYIDNLSEEARKGQQEKVDILLRNRFYTGEYDWNGRRYKGQHQPLVTKELWERGQRILDRRNARKIRGTKRDFAFTGLLNCGHCGCALVGERKAKKRPAVQFGWGTWILRYFLGESETTIKSTLKNHRAVLNWTIELGQVKRHLASMLT